MNTTSALKSFFKDSSFTNARKCPACADAVGYSFIINLPDDFVFNF